MRIVSWNIRAGGGRRVAAIAACIDEWAPAVVALSEFRATEPSRVLGAQLAAQGFVHQRSTASGQDPAANRLLVASRRPLRRIGVRNAPREPGRWLLVRVDGRPPIALGAMHVPNRVSGRKYPFLAAVLEVVRRWRGGPALFIGDTNSGRIGLDEEAPAFSRREDGWMLAMEGEGWHDAFRRVRGDERAYTWYSPNGRNGFRLDEAFVNRELVRGLRGVRHEGASSSDLGPRRDAVSDHASLILDIDC